MAAVQKLLEYSERGLSERQKGTPSIRLSAIPPSVWGRAFWRYLFLLALSSPLVGDASYHRKMQKHLLEFTELIPCASCQSHFKRRLAKDPGMTFLKGRDTFFKWIYDAREAVSRRSGKPVVSLESTIKSETQRSCSAVVAAYAKRVWDATPRYHRISRRHSAEFYTVPASAVSARKRLLASHLQVMTRLCGAQARQSYGQRGYGGSLSKRWS